MSCLSVHFSAGNSIAHNVSGIAVGGMNLKKPQSLNKCRFRQYHVVRIGSLSVSVYREFIANSSFQIYFQIEIAVTSILNN